MLKIFISKREDDQLLAKHMRQELAPYLGNNAEITMSQDVPKGEDWREWIVGELKATDLLIYLVTDESKSRDWCAYELGMFTPLSDREPKPIVCIYPPGQAAPSHINYRQGVECDAEHLAGFLRELFDGSLVGEPVNTVVADDDKLLTKIAEKLVTILTPESVSNSARAYYTRYLSFDIRLTKESSVKIPEDCRVSGDELSMEVFKLDSKQPDGESWTWKLFKPFFTDSLEKADSSPDDFFAEFEESIMASCRGEKISPS